MITYGTNLFGIEQLFIWHGSAIFRAILPAALSTLVLIVYDQFVAGEEHGQAVENPYTIQAFIGFFSLLLIFRLNYGYQRYWEATTEVYKMLAKWLDAATCLSAFHYQCDRYETVRPLCFGTSTTIYNSNRRRERQQAMDEQETQELLRSLDTQTEGNVNGVSSIRRPWKRMRPQKKQKNINLAAARVSKSFKPNTKITGADARASTRKPRPKPSRWRAVFGGSKDQKTQRRLRLLAGLDSTTQPSAFLQEATHLFSLLAAVALSTLRVDLEGADAPLIAYEPGQPFPPVNPDHLHPESRKHLRDASAFWYVVYFLSGLEQSRRARTLYNATRPFSVIGGVSQEECSRLGDARGPHAMVCVCTMWLKEFITREYLNGSTGQVAPPIVARAYQYLSEGMASYSQCRKLAFIPFPFPHAQITVFFCFTIVLVFPVLFFTFVGSTIFAYVLNFATVLAFLGIHEVARTLETPYFAIPNDLPLNNYQAQYNESLISLYAGFHPDSWRHEEAEMASVDEDKPVES